MLIVPVDRATVDAAHVAALKAGAKDKGFPGDLPDPAIRRTYTRLHSWYQSRITTQPRDQIVSNSTCSKISPGTYVSIYFVVIKPSWPLAISLWSPGAPKCDHHLPITLTSQRRSFRTCCTHRSRCCPRTCAAVWWIPYRRCYRRLLWARNDHDYFVSNAGAFRATLRSGLLFMLHFACHFLAVTLQLLPHLSSGLPLLLPGFLFLPF